MQFYIFSFEDSKSTYCANIQGTGPKRDYGQSVINFHPKCQTQYSIGILIITLSVIIQIDRQ